MRSNVVARRLLDGLPQVRMRGERKTTKNWESASLSFKPDILILLLSFFFFFLPLPSSLPP